MPLVIFLALLVLPDDPPQPPKGLHQVVVVTAARSAEELTRAASLASVLSATELREAPTLTLDDQLRQVPGFSLFRRTSSLVAHPTTQGVSLRGIGPSGAGRSLVLFDGIPLNDPLGGWVYWNRLPGEAVDSVEVVRGAASQLYGSSAMGGTIQLLSRPPTGQEVSIEAQIGTRDTYDVDAAVSGRTGGWSYFAGGRAFTTSGFYLLSERDRGLVDIPARSQFQNFFGRARYRDFHFGLNLFHEDRINGTRLQNNNSHLEMLELGMERPKWKWNFYGQPGLFYSTFSSVAADRRTETLTEVQRTPTAAMGGSVIWQPRGRLVTGVDWRYARAFTRNQNLAGLFLQDTFALSPRVDLLLGGRVDAWQNRATHGGFHPRAGLVVRAAEKVTLRASAYSGFRAPTLNELYRPFRAGIALTLPNADLRDERLWGGEMGADFYPSGSLLIRVNAFYNVLSDPVSNFTISSSRTQILRQRRNLGGAVIKGVETEAQWRPRDGWRVRASYLYSDARVEDSSLRLPQTARHQGSFSLAYAGPVTVVAEARAATYQFDNDLNTLVLGGYPLVGFSVRRPVSRQVELFISAENLLGKAYAVAATPPQQLGTPRMIHGGVQWRLAK